MKCEFLPYLNPQWKKKRLFEWTQTFIYNLRISSAKPRILIVCTPHFAGADSMGMTKTMLMMHLIGRIPSEAQRSAVGVINHILQ
ncbi:hypothetical protein TNIN_131261 [Trichonephila inaurata madagascariensis]|uniref:Uncharacterized protein n=1 Tax=Trichonephila inaurata madagascariensis TaxID=2747483 RepID=A0A8X6K1F7_9ARAC|nr:hypothetical protein TNIN_131261 [Trichonephila inaurata madagascariensis]